MPRHAAGFASRWRSPEETEIALNLMRIALALLDRQGETLVAARLQHAIDSVGAE